MFQHVRSVYARLATDPKHIALAAAMIVASAARAEVIVDMTFTAPNGLENTGVGPDGVLKGGASILANQLFLNGDNEDEPAGAGLDLPLGSYGKIFSGGNDFLVEFDFKAVPGDTGSLFSADGSLAQEDPDFQAGSLNIYLGTGPDSGVTGIIADFWFLGEVAVEQDLDLGIQFNDGEYHHVKLQFTAATKTAELTVDDVEPEFDDFDFLRKTSGDIVRLGDENNPDFGADINDGFNGFFDNLHIEGTPEPTSFVLMGIGGLMYLGGRRGIRR